MCLSYEREGLFCTFFRYCDKVLDISVYKREAVICFWHGRWNAKFLFMLFLRVEGTTLESRNLGLFCGNVELLDFEFA